MRRCGKSACRSATTRDDTVEALSLGNQQRVQLASALTHDPTALVLDEPFSGLDPLAVESMSATLRQKADEGLPVLFSSHQLELVEKLCDRVGILSNGSLVACGTIAQLRANAPARTEFGGSASACETVRREAHAAGLQVTEHGDGLLVDGAPEDPRVARLATVALEASGLTRFARYDEPLSLMYRSVVDVSPATPAETEPTPKRRWWKKGGAR
nr:ATP-binding cassette domain-containing protein [Nanchangia anserum]